MPRTLKRRSEVLNNNDDDEGGSPEPPARRQRRSSSIPSVSPSASGSPDPDTHLRSHGSNTQTLVKKLVRLALSTEYARQPLRRTDITQKIFKDNGGLGGGGQQRSFKAVFEGAQGVLRRTFGMEMLELPAREKTTLKDRRAQATQAGGSASAAAVTSSSSSSKAWILVSVLPAVYKRDAVVCPPARAPTREAEAEYTALYTFVLALVYLNNSVLTDAKLERYLKRVNADAYTPVGQTDKLLQRMAKEGYIEKRRDTSSGEEMVEWVVGPRGKVEVGVRGVADLVKGVYGLGKKSDSEEQADGEEEPAEGAALVKIEEEELNRRLERSLGVKLFGDSGDGGVQPQQMDVDDDEQHNVERPRNRRGRRGNDGNSDGDRVGVPAAHLTFHDRGSL